VSNPPKESQQDMDGVGIAAAVANHIGKHRPKKGKNG
jgi:hypothetical protein